MKKCTSCQKKVDDKVIKCPYCQTDLRNWFKRHPTLTFLLIIFLLPIFLATLSPTSNNPSSTTKLEQKPAITSKTAEQVLDDLINTLNSANEKAGFQLYKNVAINENGWATFTISDGWYNLEPHIQERLVKIAVGQYKDVEDGFNNYAEVYLKDQFGKEVATGWYSSAGIKVEIF